MLSACGSTPETIIKVEKSSIPEELLKPVMAPVPKKDISELTDVDISLLIIEDQKVIEILNSKLDKISNIIDYSSAQK